MVEDRTAVRAPICCLPPLFRQSQRGVGEAEPTVLLPVTDSLSCLGTAVLKGVNMPAAGEQSLLSEPHHSLVVLEYWL